MRNKLELPDKQPPYLMAHRGNNVLFPENTMEAFKQALSDGADILETDLHITADHHIVCIHDATVDRTTNGSGAVATMPLQDLLALNASANHPRYHQPTHVPALHELLSILPETTAIALEIKTDAFLLPASVASLYQLLQKFNVHHRTLILSFHHEHLAAFKQNAPDLSIGLISMWRLLPFRSADVSGVFFPMLFINPLLPAMAHQNGQLFCPLDPKPDKRLRFYRWIGCDAILSDDPGTTRLEMDRIWKKV